MKSPGHFRVEINNYARLDAPNDLILSTGIPNYDPTTFAVEYPQ